MDLQEQPVNPIPDQAQRCGTGAKTYIYIAIGFLTLIIIAAGIYWTQKQAYAPFELVPEETLNGDLSDLESLEADKSLDGLEHDLTRAAGEQVVVETASIENLEKEFSLELGSLSDDLSGLEGFSSDTSLDALDAGLVSVGQ